MLFTEKNWNSASMLASWGLICVSGVSIGRNSVWIEVHDFWEGWIDDLVGWEYIFKM